MSFPSVNPLFSTWFEQNHRQLNIQALFFDIDGTLVHGKEGLPGVNDQLKKLREEKFPFLLLTNDANHSREEKIAILKRRGITVMYHEMVSAGQVLKPFIEQHHLQGKRAFIMGDLGNPSYAEAAGLVVEKKIEKAHDVDLLIMGEGEHNWQMDLTVAINILRNRPCVRLVSPNPDGYWPGLNGNIGVGAGGKARFIKMILAEAGVKIHIDYLGKPYEGVFELAMVEIERQFKMPLQHENCMMLGDNLSGDILGAKRLGIRAGLMLTGITQMGMLKGIAPSLMPDDVFEKMGDGSPYEADIRMNSFLESE